MAALISCQEAIYEMQEALEGSPSPELYQHLCFCESCLTLWRALEATHSLLQKYPQPFITPPPALKAEVMRASKKEMGRRKILRAVAAPILISSAGAFLTFVLYKMAFMFWNLLPAAGIVLRLTLRWLWLCKELVGLLLELTLSISKLALYPTVTLLVLLAIFISLIKIASIRSQLQKGG